MSARSVARCEPVAQLLRNVVMNSSRSGLTRQAPALARLACNHGNHSVSQLGAGPGKPWMASMMAVRAMGTAAALEEIHEAPALRPDRTTAQIPVLTVPAPSSLPENSLEIGAKSTKWVPRIRKKPPPYAKKRADNNTPEEEEVPLVPGAVIPSSGLPEVALEAEKDADGKMSEKAKDRETTRADRNKLITYSQRVKSLVEAGKLDDAHGMLEDMRRLRIRPNEVCFNTVMAGYARKGASSKCFKLLNEMKKRGLKPTLYTYSTMFNAYAEGDGDHVEDALKLYQEMRDRELVPSLETYNALMKVCARAGQLQRCMAVYQDMKNDQIEANSFTFTFLMEACVNGGRLPAAIDLLRAASKVVKVTPHMYTVLLRACRQSKNPADWQSGVELFDRMTNEDKLSPGLPIFDLMVTLYFKAGKPELVDPLLEMMQKMQVAPNGQFYNTLLVAHTCAGDAMGADTILKEMQSRGFEPDMHAYTWRIARSSRVSDVMEILETMDSKNLRPTTFAIAAVLKIGARRKSPPLIREAMQRMGKASLRVDENIMAELRRLASLKGHNSETMRTEALRGLEALGLEMADFGWLSSPRKGAAPKGAKAETGKVVDL